MMNKEPIAIIGFDSVLPGEAKTPESFFDMLLKGRSARSEVPSSRFNIDAFYHPDHSRVGTTRTRYGHFIQDDIAAFDAPFFAMTPAQAAALDPQQRGLLESTYRALENAGITLEHASGSDTSVFIGNFARDYNHVMPKDPEVDFKYMATGMDGSMLSARLSWFYNFKGPSLTVETACSSSLTACHLACQSLNTFESSMAVVGGCNLIFAPEPAIHLSGMRFLSPDGISYSFDHRANGYARGEGFGVLILKRLSDALRDKDSIRAVIRNTACNQDGRSPSITQPMKDAQIDLIRRTYEEVGLDPCSTKYFEAHATGTAIGDPTEMSAISAVFSQHRSPQDPMYVGAVKTNIGHLEGAAGIASLLKVVHVLERGVIPGNMWFEELNPKIDIDKERFRFPVAAQPWPGPGPRRVSVNGFGFGGTNVHIVLDDARSYLESHGQKGTHYTVDSLEVHKTHKNGILQPSECGYRLFVFSAADEEGVKRLIQGYVHYLNSKRSAIKSEDRFLDDLSYTLSQKRTLFPWRTAVVADNVDSLIQALAGAPRPVRAATSPRVSFVFTGQGAQWPQMGKELLAFPTFKESLQLSGTYLQSIGRSWSLMDETSKDDSNLNINDPELSQPITTALQLALVDLLASWSVQPCAAIGHSSGEIAAAYAAGAISKEAALRIAYYRGVVSSRLTNSKDYAKAGMLAVSLSSIEVSPYLEKASKRAGIGSLTVACINSPVNVTVSGGINAIDALEDLLKAENIFCRKLRVKNGFHSQYMLPAAKDYRTLIGIITPGSSDKMIPFYSSFKGGRVELQQLRDPDYWVGNLLSPVLFSKAMTSLLEDSALSTTSVPNLVEIGPHAALQGPIRETAQTLSSKSFRYSSVLRRGSSAIDTALDAAGRLYTSGLKINVFAINTREDRRNNAKTLVNLPSYPFNHSKTYWNESRMSKSYRFRKTARHDLVGAPASDWNAANAVWTNRIRVSENPWIRDLQLDCNLVYPAAGVLAMVLEACKQLASPEEQLSGFRFQAVSFLAPIIIPDSSEGLEVRLYIHPPLNSASWSEFEFWSFENDWTCHCRGQVLSEYARSGTAVQGSQLQEGTEDFWNQVFTEADGSCLDERPLGQVWDSLGDVGLGYGPAFRNYSNLRLGPANTAVVTVTAPDLEQVMPHGYVHPHLIHPTTLEGAVLVGLLASSAGGQKLEQAAILKSIDHLWISASSSASLRVFARTNTCGAHLESQLTGADSVSLKPSLTAKGLVFMTVPSKKTGLERSAQQSLCFAVDWKPDPSFLDRDSVPQNVNGSPTPLPTADADLVTELELLRYVYLKRYACSYGLNDIDSSQKHYQKYVSWIQHVFDRHERGHLLSASPDWNRLAEDDDFVAALERKLTKANPEGKMTVIVGRLLPKILKGEISPLEVLFKDKLVETAYRAQPGAEYCLSVLGRFMDLLAHKNPSLNILEVGAGTGAATKAVLDALAQRDPNGSIAPRFARYDFTDLSTAFLQNAKASFHEIGGSMSFGILNIEQNPADQGYPAGQYDVFIAANVLHATRSIDVTLKNARALLKPGGKLILHELTSPENIGASFVFGLLSGWWLHEEPYREWSPLLTVDGWDSHLRRAGFSGVDLSFDDFADPAKHQHSIMIATAVDNSNAPERPPIVVILDVLSPLQTETARLLQEQLREADVPCELCPLASFEQVCVEGRICIFLPGLQANFLENFDVSSFKKLQSHCASATGICWLTQDSGPEAELAAWRNEYANMRLITLSLRPASGATTVKDLVWKLLKGTFFEGGTTGLDNTFSEADNVIHVPRVVQATNLNRQLSDPQMASLDAEDQSALVLRAVSPGAIESLHFTDDILLDQPLEDSEVEFRIEAAGLASVNVREILGEVVRMHRGFEAAGTVTRTGPNAKFKVGDRVCGLSRGSFGTFTRAHHHTLVEVADQLTWTSAAYFPMAFITAHAALYEYGRIQKGCRVLIHGASHGLLWACVQLAQMAGAEVFANVDSKEERNTLLKDYHIPESHIFGEDPMLATKIMRLTDDRGVDVVVNSLSGIAADTAFECIAPFGRIVDVRSRDADGLAQLNSTRFKENVSISFLDPGCISASGELFVGRTLETVMQLLQEGKLQGVQPPHIYPMSKVQEAFNYLYHGSQSEIVVLQRHEKEEIMAMTKPKPSTTLDARATYVISGGLDRLGRAVSRWMVERGAKSLLFLSPAGPKESAIQEMTDKLTSKGVMITTRPCDNLNDTSLKQVIADCSTILPPIKGCVQCTIVKEQPSFNNMSVNNFKAAGNPSHQGSSNLQNALSPGLDFFVMLSSTSGATGDHDREIQGVANTFLDALSRPKAAFDQRVASVDLSDVLSVESNTELTAIQGQELSTLLDELCDPSSPQSGFHNGRMILRSKTVEDIQERSGEIMWMQDPIFSHLRSVRSVHSSESSVAAEHVSYQTLLRAAKSYEAAVEIVRKAITWKICQALSIDVQVDTSRPPHDYGVDSLVAVELRSWFEKEMGAKVATTDIIGNGNLDSLITLIASGSSIVSFK